MRNISERPNFLKTEEKTNTIYTQFHIDSQIHRLRVELAAGLNRYEYRKNVDYWRAQRKSLRRIKRNI